MTIPHDTDIYELMTSPGATTTVQMRGKSKKQEIKIEPWPLNIDPYVEVSYPLKINH